VVAAVDLPGGEVGARMRAMDWSRTPLGPAADWPRSLRTTLALVVASPRPMAVWWGDALLHLHNDAFHAILGDPDAFGRPAAEVWRAAWDRIGPPARAALRSGEGAVVEAVRVAETWLELSLSPVPADEGGAGGVLCIASGGARRVERRSAPPAADAERTVDEALPDGGEARVPALEAAHARRLAGLFEHVPAAIAILRGPEHVFELVNGGFRGLTGQRPILGKSAREALPELEGQGIFELLDRIRATGEPYVGRALRVLMADRDGGPLRERFFDFVYQPLRDFDGRAEDVVVVASEVTELVRARREAEAANRAKDEFLAMLGHELRNPLAPITTALQLMRLRGGDALERERTVIERQIGHLTRLVDDLLDVSRIARGKIELKRQVVELAEVVHKAIEMASPLLEERRHHLRTSLPPRGLRVDGDAVRLAQVVSNLVANAAKYTEPGGLVQVSAQRIQDRVVLTVSDNGTGISAEMLPRIFDLFAQGAQSLDRSRGGLGLGLTIVRSLVALHGGTVTAHSPGEGRGSTFTVELPFAATSPWDVPTSPGLVISAAGLRVLIVDDNRDAADLLAELLARAGCLTRVAYDGPSGLRAAEALDPDVCLLDIGLPVMDGYELARRLGELRPERRPYLVAVTGYGQASDRRRAEAAGFDAHLVKPVDGERLHALLRDLRH
jgi:PAS domain S-box-containing protein